MLSIIIPARNEPYLHKTIKDLLSKTSDIEIIAVLDGYWPRAEDIVQDERVNYLHYSTARGMRNAINKAVALAKGEYILKTDAHCLFDTGFDKKVIDNCARNVLIVPRRYRLDPEKWEVIQDGRPPVDYEYIDSSDLHGVRWDQRAIDRKHYQFDDIISAQGSCWAMSKYMFEKIGGLDEDRFGKFFLEFQELSFKVWFNEGMVLVNKTTYYAHWHKTKGRGYSLDNDREKAVKGLREYVNEHKEQFDALVKKFLPMPTWEASA
jgi:glycosyltransferase involved in cell wall biosynthesis